MTQQKMKYSPGDRVYLNGQHVAEYYKIITATIETAFLDGETIKYHLKGWPGEYTDKDLFFRFFDCCRIQ